MNEQSLNLPQPISRQDDYAYFMCDALAKMLGEKSDGTVNEDAVRAIINDCMSDIISQCDSAADAAREAAAAVADGLDGVAVKNTDKNTSGLVKLRVTGGKPCLEYCEMPL